MKGQPVMSFASLWLQLFLQVHRLMTSWRGALLSRAIHVRKGVKDTVQVARHLRVTTNCGGGPYSQLQHTPAWLCSPTHRLTEPTLDFAACLSLSVGPGLKLLCVRAQMRQASEQMLSMGRE